MMFLVTVGIRVLEFMFFVGWIGSLLVILLSGIEDLETVFEKDEPGSPPPSPPLSAQEPGMSS